MKNLILVLATIATVSLGAVFTCDEAGYNAYLTTYESKCAKFPLDMCDAETFRYVPPERHWSVCARYLLR